MPTRRLLLSGLTALGGCAAAPSVPAPGAPPAPAVPAPVQEVAGRGDFDQFVAGLRPEAQRAGVSAATFQRAFAGVRPNQRVIELDRRQAEGSLAWESYRDRIVNPNRVETGRRLYAENRALLERIEARYRVSPRVVVAIWGIETNFGGNTGGFGVIEALATLAWEGRRASYFRQELLAALRVLEGGHIAPERMRGSWAGAMGQPQFMPSNFERLAVDFDGDGRRDIWDSRADALGSIANYFARNGWRDGETWGREVLLPSGLVGGQGDPDDRRPVRDWARLGVRRADGTPLPVADIEAAVVIPRGTTGQAFLVYHNWRVIRRYNPPVFYATAVGLLSDRVA